MGKAAEWAHKRHTTKKTSCRLGPGDFVEPGVEDKHGVEEKGEARRLFLEAIETHAPVVLERLRDAVLPEYRQACREWLVEWNREPGGPIQVGLLMLRSATFRQKVENWAHPFHLTDNGRPAPWIIQALDAALWLLGEGWVKGVFPGIFFSHYRLPAEEQEIRFPTYQWNPQADPRRAEFERSIRRAIKTEFPKILKARLDAIENAARTAGLKEVPLKRQPEHFKWAVEFQCGKKDVWTFPGCDESSKYYEEARRKVRSGIHDVLQRVGLTPRPDRRRGRPAGT